ncbi:MAG: hypothetical protein ACWGQW_13535, partial [bacterium]
MSGRFNSTQWNTIRWNGATVSVFTPTMKALYNQRSVALTWAVEPGATHYKYEVSLFPDFRTIFEQGLMTNNFITFTDNEADNAKRYWRFRASDDGGTTWMAPYSYVGSYWIDTSATEEIFLSRNQWMVVDPENVTDQYLFDLFPIYQIIEQNLYRIQERNRGGDLLSEYLTTKSQITLNFSGAQFIDHVQFHELLRFHTEIRTIFLVANIDGECQTPMPHIWKVEFT